MFGTKKMTLINRIAIIATPGMCKFWVSLRGVSWRRIYKHSLGLWIIKFGNNTAIKKILNVYPKIYNHTVAEPTARRSIIYRTVLSSQPLAMSIAGEANPTLYTLVGTLDDENNYSDVSTIQQYLRSFMVQEDADTPVCILGTKRLRVQW